MSRPFAHLTLLTLEDRLTPSGAPPVITTPIATSALTRLTATAGGTAGNDDSGIPSFSAGGRYVVFASAATNLVTGDTNGVRDIFRKDLVTGVIVRVSVAADGTQGNDNSFSNSISPDGRYVMFASDATNLVAGDTNGVRDIFRKDLVTGVIVRASTAADGSQSDGGSFLNAGTTDGRFVVFRSAATNLVAGDTNGVADIFRKDLTTGAVVRVNTTVGGGESNGFSDAPRMSADARFVSFESDATNLVAGDANAATDVFRKDLLTGEIVNVSTTAGANGNGASRSAEISGDGRYVSFETDASNLTTGDTNAVTDVLRKDLTTGTVVRVSTSSAGAQANALSQVARMSADGRFISFESVATNLVTGDTNALSDVFRKDLVTGTLVRVSVAPGGTQANAASTLGYLSSDGQVVAFVSGATNLLTGNGSGIQQVYATGGVGSAAVTVAENTTAVTTVTATDPENDTLTYSLVAGNDSARFAINPTTGVLTFVAAPDFEAPTDANGDNVYELTVRVFDGTLTDDQDILAVVTNVNEAPVIAGGASFNVPENTTAVTTVPATDPENDPLTYSLVAGDDSARFAINPTTGVLTFVAAPNFEAPTDANGDNLYVVTVRVFDTVLTTTRTLSVTVTNVNETPTITSGTSFSTDENVAAVTTVTATDPDGGTSLSFSVAGGADAGLFAVNPTTGALTFLAPPDFEAPADANADNVYVVSVQVSDGALTDVRTLTVTVANVNEVPVITSGAAVNAAENQTAVTTVTATDQDAGAALLYALAGGADAALFAINAATGALTFLAPRNFEAPADADANSVYEVIVRASDGTLTVTQTVSVTVTNVNEAPAFTGTVTAVTVNENTTAVATLTATDPDAATTLTFSVAGGADAALFAVNAATGALAFVAAPDFEAPADADANNVYVVTVQVSDGALTATRTVTVTVLPVPTLPFADAFDPTPTGALAAYWLTKSGAFSVAAGAARGTAAGANTAVVRTIAAADVAVSATVRPQVGGLLATGLVARYRGAPGTATGDQNMYWGALNVFGAQPYTQYSAQIWKNVGGTWSNITFNAVPIHPADAVGKTLRFEVFGASLKLYLNDTLLCFAVDTSLPTAGGVGLRTALGSVLDDFAAVTFAPVTAALPFHDAFPANPPRQTLAPTWQERSGFFTVTTGRAVGGSAGQPNVATLNGVSAANATVTADLFFTAAGQTAQLVGRYRGTSGTGDSNYYVATLDAQAGGNALVRILKNVNGTVTELGRKSLAGFFPGGVFTTPVTAFQFRMLGTQLSVRIGATTHLTVTDGTFAAGSVGVRTSKNVGVDEFDVTSP